MLLIYEDCEKVLGQWRYDKDLKDIALGSLFLFAGQTTIGPYMKIKDSSEPNGAWYEFGGSEQITWWFTSECAMLELHTCVERDERARTVVPVRYRLAPWHLLSYELSPSFERGLQTSLHISSFITSSANEVNIRE